MLFLLSMIIWFTDIWVMQTYIDSFKAKMVFGLIQMSAIIAIIVLFNVCLGYYKKDDNQDES